MGLWGLPQGTLAALLAQAVISAGSVVVIYCLGRRLFGSRIALGAAAWATLYPQYLYYSGLIYRETLVVFGMLLLAWSVIRLPLEGSWRKGCGIAGILFLLIHIDPRFGIHLILMPGYLLLAGFPWRESLRRGGTLVLLVMLLSLPWGIRSSLVYQKLVLVNTRALDRWIAGEGVAFGLEQEPEWDHQEALLRAFEQEKRSHWDQLDPIERRAFDQGVRPSFTDVGRHLFLAREFWRFSAFRPTYRPYPDLRFIQWSWMHNLVEVVSLGLLLPFFLVGAGRVIQRCHPGGMVLLAMILGHWIPHILIHSIPRYRLPIYAFVVLVAFVGLSRIRERLRPAERHRSETAPA